MPLLLTTAEQEEGRPLTRTPLNQIHPEAKGAQNRQKKSFCPFGCADKDVDEFGYCYHLVGFMTPDQPGEPTFEEQVPDYSYDKRGVPYRNGRWKIGRQDSPLLKTDVLKNPTRTQKSNGMEVVAYYWNSHRVYRDVPKPERDGATPLPINEEMALKAQLAELRTKVEAKRNKDEIERLKKELAGELASPTEDLAALLARLSNKPEGQEPLAPSVKHRK